jgi:hypothetical protein
MRLVEVPAEPAAISLDLDRNVRTFFGWVTTAEEVATALTLEP